MHIKNAIKSGLNFITDAKVFIFNGRYYQQSDGAPMGSPISGVFSEIKLRPFEMRYLTDLYLKPWYRLWYRFVDCIFIVWEHILHELRLFRDKIN